MIAPGVDCVGYVRVSTERQAGEQFTSLADQEAAIVAHAARLGRTVGAWYRDEGASGATVHGRPGFRQLLVDCEASRRTNGLVLILNDSRFGRFPDPDEAAALRFQLKRAGWVVRFAESDENDDPTFRPVIRALGSAQASEYRRAIQRNARRGMKGAAEQGYWTREAPLGYRRAVVYPPERARVLERGSLKTADEKVKLTPHDGEARVIRWAFTTYASGEHSLGTLAKAMDAHFPERSWSRRTVQVMLANPAYAGDVRGGKRPAKGEPRRPMSDWYGAEDAHPALVSRELFADVQARLAENKRRSRGVTSDCILSGIVTCARCGLPYVGGGGGQGVKFYKCSASNRLHSPCPGPIGTITRRILDDAVLKLLTSETSRPVMREKILAALDAAIVATRKGASGDGTRLAAERRTIEKRRERLVTAVADGTLTREEAGPEIARLRADMGRVEEAQQAARFAARTAGIAEGERDRLAKILADFPAQASRLQGPALRELVRPWLAWARFDKSTRWLEVAIRRIPLPRPLLVTAGPGRDSPSCGGAGARDRS